MTKMYTDDIYSLDYRLKTEDESHARLQVAAVAKYGVLTGADGKDTKFALKLEKFLESKYAVLRAETIELVKAEHKGIN